AKQSWSEVISVRNGVDRCRLSSTRFVPPPLSFQGPKISCDEAFKDKRAAIGIILWDTNDCMVDGIGKKIPAVSSLFCRGGSSKRNLFTCSCISPPDLHSGPVVLR
ncbi:unnamed protein product, partial [Ilex paraguariensis]